MEKLMYDRLTMLLKKYNIITEAQNGFREKKYFNTAIQSFTERTEGTLDSGLQEIGIFFDFRHLLFQTITYSWITHI